MSTVVSVSIPRAGHHMLVECLNSYFDEKPLSYCEDCRGLSPAELSHYDLVKTHDFGIRKVWPLRWIRGFSKQLDFQYLMLVRDPILSAMSDFELFEKKELGRPAKREDWQRYAAGAIDYRLRFFKKWLPNQVGPNSIVVGYENFLAAPVKELSRVLKHSFKEEPVNTAKVEEIFSWKAIAARRTREGFKFYNKSELSEIQGRIHSEIERVNQCHGLNLLV